MPQNTFKHVSDEAVYTWFDPTGTKFPSTVKNVQSALALTAPIVDASKTQKGIIQLATQAEVTAGTDDSKAVTPYQLAQRLAYPQATTTVLGVVQLATNVEAQTGTNTQKAIVPSSLKYTIDWVFTNRISTESSNGVLKLSTEAAAKAGVDNTTAMTPLRTKQAIAEATKLIPSYTTATESVDGLVRLATVGQVEAGTLRNGYAISPYTLMNLTGNLTRKGVVQASTQAQAYAGTDDGLYISAKGFKTYVASTTNVGTVKLVDTIQTGVGLALASNAKVLPLSGGTITGSLTITSDLNVQGSILNNGSPIFSRSEIDDYVPIGTIVDYNGSSLPSNKWQWYDMPFSSELLVARTITYTGNPIDLSSFLPGNEDFTDSSRYTILITPEQPNEGWVITRLQKGFKLYVFNRSGTNRIGYSGLISFSVYKNSSQTRTKIIRV